MRLNNQLSPDLHTPVLSCSVYAVFGLSLLYFVYHLVVNVVCVQFSDGKVEYSGVFRAFSDENSNFLQLKTMLQVKQNSKAASLKTKTMS